jgi:hypothetical protein
MDGRRSDLGGNGGANLGSGRLGKESGWGLGESPDDDEKRLAFLTYEGVQSGFVFVPRFSNHHVLKLYY